MSFDPLGIARKPVRNFEPYRAGTSVEAVMRSHGLAAEDIIKLASNENPFGTSPRASLAAQQALTTDSRYPDSAALLAALGTFHAINPERIVLGAGSTELIHFIAQTFLEPGANVIVSEYAFAMFGLLSRLYGAETTVAAAKAFGHDLNAIESAITASTQIIWLANPNNPTGTLLPYNRLKNFLEKVDSRIIVVVDEAYYDYLDPAEHDNLVAWTDDFPNLIVLRTFSKAYGLAGLRIGYGIMDSKVAGLLRRVKQPFNVSGPALAAAQAALADQDFVKECTSKNKTGRSQLKDGLDKLGLSSLPSYGNFVTVKVSQANHLFKKLLGRGIIVRPLAAYGMDDYLRISVGTPEQNERLLTSLKELI